MDVTLDSNSDEEIFFTPTSSPRSSYDHHRVPNTMQSLVALNFPTPLSPGASALLQSQVGLSSKKYKKPLPPALRMPVEVMVKIFHECMPPAPVQPTTDNAPILLCRICNFWRQIAISAPTLWCSISVRPERELDRSILPIWLERSRTCLLNVSITASSAEHTQPVWSCADRLEYLQLSVTNLSLLPTRPSLQFSNLTMLVILDPLRNLCTRNAARSLSAKFKHTPSLREITWGGWVCISRLTFIQWRHITRIHVVKSGTKLDGWLMVLRQTQQLVELSFSEVNHQQFSSAGPIITLQHLERLHAVGGAQLLQRLSLPKLKKLHYWNDILIDDPLALGLRSFFLRCCGKLEHLILENTAFHDDSLLLDCLMVFPAVVEFHVICWRSCLTERSSFDTLIDSTRCEVLPSMEHLILEGPCTSFPRLESLINIVDRRFHGSQARLKSITAPHGPAQDAAIDRMNDLQKHGLLCAWTCEYGDYCRDRHGTTAS